MNNGQWQKVKEIFDLALQQKPEDRQKYLNEACDDDKDLLNEIESLLVSLGNADEFLENPAIEEVADVIENETQKLEIIKSFGHYEIIKPIGAGGMGEVYLAKDTKLDRQVAIKILNQKFAKHESNLQRFVTEAKSASALNHPNILVIHEIGESENAHYIVSEYIEGKTLRQILQEKSLDLKAILDISIQIANALAAAHTRHLIHRDIKPENIIVRSDDLVKILDFGLAKLVVQKPVGFDESTIKQNETAKGIIMGTVNYMSPEQAKGEKVDARSDIFSFGVLLYEMIAGKTPFQGDSISETFANLINKEPQPLSHFALNIPDELQRIVGKMLRKNKNERYQTMQDVQADLKNIRKNLTTFIELEHSQSPQNQATAVLPAKTSDSINQPTANLSPKLLSRQVFIGFGVFVALLAGAFGVYQIRNFNQTPSTKDLFLQARFYAARENKPDNDKAIQLLEQIVALDPNNALAHAELARSYGKRFFYLDPQKQWEEKSYVELEKAFALAPDLPEAHEVRGFLLWTPTNRFPHEQAITAYRRALALNPNLDEAHHQLGVIYLHIGLLDEALVEIHKSLDLNPGNTLARFRIGVILNYQGRYEESLRALKSSPTDFNWALVGRAIASSLICLGRREEASELIDQMLENYPNDEGGQFISLKAMLSALSGDAKKAEQEIQEAIEKGKGFGHFHHTAFQIACAYALMSKPKEAVRFLQMAADDGFPCYPLFENDINLNGIRQSPEFIKFMSEMKAQNEQYRGEFK